MAVVERWLLVEVGVWSKTVVIMSLKCFTLRETFVNLEKTGPRMENSTILVPCQLEKQD